MFSRHLINVSSQVSTKSNITLRKIPCHRSFHAACKYLKRNSVLYISQAHKSRPRVNSATFVRYINVASTDDKSATKSSTNNDGELLAESTPIATDSGMQADVITQIPEPPAQFVQEITEALISNPTLQDLGLGSNYPPGLIQQLLNYLHTTFDIPWWGAIAMTTVCIRTLMLPIVIKIQRYAARMQNVQPQIQYMQEQMTEARKMQDHLEVARLTADMYQYMKDKNVNPLTNMWLPLIQAPVFLSFFWALRGMVQLPLESMKDGGMLWFTDLTVPDPYYLLPVITSTTLFVTIEMGVDTVQASSMAGNMKYIMRLLPIIMFPFIVKFEGAILIYWVSTNIYSLCQVSILRIPKVRKFCQIPEKVVHDKKIFNKPKKNFIEGFTDSWTNMKVARDLQNREIYDEIVFKRAGRGPIPKTYKYDPTKVIPSQSANAILSKKTD
ncbi:mitochondrial inner membrane protein OXA1L [Phymastichus coffea]|uniref:mitochondrial inner membrane protein OXA1L n=1 Tax=Phymastichus coffea TaxID=108790 RepID=UPI00273CAF17|nr:mitochondrial inner membrane protein OXA1L [Phymastichus coffea]